ncbi:MAG: protein serine/threonine phosphatase [Deltaproteobacteria bacterium]|nr:protein serine/threonine phosphatase [Deltaproteobacteria bacterium]
MLTVQSAGISDIGKKRESNEDRLCIDDAQGLYLVADGMGGHRAGEIASSLVVKSIRDFFVAAETPAGKGPRADLLSPEAGRLLAGIEWSNRVVHETAATHADYRGMGSTVSAVYLGDETVIAANVGDSPIYLIRNDHIDLLSVPHTLQADFANETFTALMGNILTRAVGSKDTVDADICELNAFKGDVLVICSDGLSTKVPPLEIMSIATSRPPDEACRELVDLANARGGDDNISAVLLRVTGVRRGSHSVFGKWRARVRRRLAAIMSPHTTEQPLCRTSH